MVAATAVKACSLDKLMVNNGFSRLFVTLKDDPTAVLGREGH